MDDEAKAVVDGFKALSEDDQVAACMAIDGYWKELASKEAHERQAKASKPGYAGRHRAQ